MDKFICPRCSQEHDWTELEDVNVRYSQSGNCPTTKKRVSWWITESGTQYGKDYRHFGNNIVQVKFLNVFYGTLFNHGVDNLAIVFNEKADYYVVNCIGNIVKKKPKGEEIEIRNIIEDTLESYELFPTGKTIFGDEETATYLINQQGYKYELGQLMKLHFNTHGRTPDPVVVFQIAQMLNPTFDYTETKKYLKENNIKKQLKLELND